MAKSKKKKSLLAQEKRVSRSARLESAKSWLPTFISKHLVRAYCDRYGVNWLQAAIELKLLGIEMDPAYLAARERGDADRVKRRREKKEKRKLSKDEHWHPYTDVFSAYLAGDFPAMYELEMKERYGDDWEQHALNASFSCTDSMEDDYEFEDELSGDADDIATLDPADEDDIVPF